MNVRLFVGVALLTSIALTLLGCNEGGGGNSASAAVKAKNIVFRSSEKNSMLPGDQPANDQVVYADNVQLETANNSLSSTNLQDALDNEMAISLRQLLSGTTWTIVNKTRQVEYAGTTGQVTFSEGSFTVDSGLFAAAGITLGHNLVDSTTPVPYEILSNGVLYFSVNNIDGVIVVVAKSKNTLVLVGDGGEGLQGVSRISVLTRVL